MTPTTRPPAGTRHAGARRAAGREEPSHEDTTRMPGRTGAVAGAAGVRGAADDAHATRAAGGRHRRTPDGRTGLTARLRHVHRAHRQHDVPQPVGGDARRPQVLLPDRREGPRIQGAGEPDAAPDAAAEVAPGRRERRGDDGQGEPVRRRSEPAHRARRLGAPRNPPGRPGPGQGQGVHGAHRRQGHAGRQGRGRAGLGQRRKRATGRAAACGSGRLRDHPAQLRLPGRRERRGAPDHRHRLRQLLRGRRLPHAGRQRRGLPGRHHRAHQADQLRLLALRRQLHLRLRLVRRHRRPRPASADLGLRLERHADERPGHGRVRHASAA